MAHSLSHEDIHSGLMFAYSGWMAGTSHVLSMRWAKCSRAQRSMQAHMGGLIDPLQPSWWPNTAIYRRGEGRTPHEGRKAHMRPVAKPRSVLALVPDQGTPTNREGRGAKRRVRTASAAPKARVSAMPTHRPLVMSEAKNLRDVCHPSLCPFFFPTNETRSVSEEVDMAGGEGIS